MTVKHALRRPYHALSTAASEFPSLPSNTSKNYPHYLALLSSCKVLKSLLQIHAHFIVSGLKENHATPTLTHLINSYSFFHKCDLARSVFEFTSNPPVTLWNSMIRAYTRSNNYKEALNMYNSMLEKGCEPDKYTFTFVLKACTAAFDLQKGVLVHREIARRGLECDVFIGTGLVDIYCKMGDLKSARKVFDFLPKKDVVAWNTMIAGLSQSEEPREALGFFWSMQVGGVEPDSVSLLNLVPAVSRLADVDSCKSIHGYVVRRDFRPAISNGLIDMYSKCGDVNSARCVFDYMWGRDDVSWKTMMAGYVFNGCFFKVLKLFDGMRVENCKIDKVSAVSALLAAAEMRDLEKGKEIHDCALQEGIDSDVLVATPIMTMYIKCGELEKAKQLFKELKRRDLIAWSAFITALVQSGFPEEALSIFQDMQNHNLKPDNTTAMSILPACAELLAIRLGKSMHCYAIKADFDFDISTGTALVSMYSKWGLFTWALNVFNRMPCKDVVTWNVLINGYVQIGDPYCGMEFFRELQLSGIHPDAGTMAGLLHACSMLNDLHQGTSFHGKIMRSGFESDCPVRNALIDMYAKCGSLSSAEFLFYKTEFGKDEVSWNVIIAGYMENAHAKKAMYTFYQMKMENFRPNLVTFVSVLPAVASLAALQEGMAFHACIIRMGFLSNTLVGNSLINMYAKCGQLNYSEKCFNEMENKNTVSWNAMLAGYAVHGQGNNAIALFSLMQESQVQVDSVSFINVLSACRHAGLIEEGKEIFKSMSEKHQFKPELEHYACMVDLLGRAGLFDETLILIKIMPMEPDAGVWGALLGACKMYSNIKLGEIALQHLVKLEPENPTNYIVLSSLFAESGKWGDEGSTRSRMIESGLKKTPGFSWVEAKNRVHACIQSG
ncbi:pentatricopeptide repeat-containing protein At2g39620 [Fagus crenata]